MIVNYGGADDVDARVRRVARPFTGSWEYLLDQAIFTSPPTLNWSGAALIDKDGKLLGIGSLIVREATDGRPAASGQHVRADRCC